MTQPSTRTIGRRHDIVVTLLVLVIGIPGFAAATARGQRTGASTGTGTSGTGTPPAAAPAAPQTKPDPGTGAAGAQSTGDQAAPQGSLPPHLTTPDSRLTVGFSSTVQSGLPRTFTYLIDFSLVAPLSHHQVTQTEKPSMSAWLNARLTGEPQTTAPGVQQYLGGFTNGVSSGSAESLVQTAHVLGGVEFKLNNGFNFGGDTHYQFEPLAIAGFGFTTSPPGSGPIPIFSLTDNAAARERYIPLDDPKRDDYKYIGFVAPETRDFFPQYYAGLRFRTHHFQECSGPDVACSPDVRVNFPGTIDIVIGQNAAVTGGHLVGPVLGLDVFYPLPADNIANAIYFFGSAFKQLRDVHEYAPIILKAPDATVTVPSADLYLHELTRDERKRDMWQFGVAVDLVRLFKGATPVSETTLSGPEDAVLVTESDAARVMRVTLKPGDTARLVDIYDTIVEMTGGTVTVTKDTARGGHEEQLWTPGEARFEAGHKTSLVNAGDTDVSALVIRAVKDAATSTSKDFASDADAAMFTRVVPYTNSRVQIERFDCKAACTLTRTAGVAATIVVPVTKVTRIDLNKKAGPKTPIPVVAASGSEYVVTAPSGATFVVVQIK
jgi:hypothetical protein